MFWNKKKDKIFNLNIINSVIETSHEITDRLYFDLRSKYSDYNLPSKELFERQLFLTCIAVSLFNASFAANDDKFKKALTILSERLNEDAFLQVCEYLKYTSKLSLMADTSGDKMSEYISYWLYMNVRDTDEFIEEETPPYMFAGSVIYNVFNNFLDNKMIIK